jgi:flavin-binding protein dodecin
MAPIFFFFQKKFSCSRVKKSKEVHMSIVKVIEVIGEGDSVDSAIKASVAEVAKTVKNIRQLNVEHIEALVENNKVTKFRVNAKVSFLVEH